MTGCTHSASHLTDPRSALPSSQSYRPCAAMEARIVLRVIKLDPVFFLGLRRDPL